MTHTVGDEEITGIDRAWLEMDTPQNPMVVSAVLELTGVRDVEVLLKHLLERMLRHRRFLQRADVDHDPPMWRDDGEPLMAYHVRVYHLTEDAPDHDVRHAVARELGRSLDRALPLWRLTLLERGDGRVTLLIRVHHAIADGVALVRILMSCTDAASGGRRASDQRPARPRKGPLGVWIERLEFVNRTLEDLKEGLRADLQDPSRILRQLRTGREAVAAVSRVLNLPDDNPESLHRALSGTRNVAWTRHLPLGPIRRRARQLQVKINDLFVAALAGAFGRYLRELGGSVDPGQNVRIEVPVNLRKEGDGDAGNRFGLVLLDLPVGVADWRERLRIVSARMEALKDSPEAKAILVGLMAAGHLPVPVEKRLVSLLASKAVAVVSNLPGPRTSLRFAGARLENLVFWPPQAGAIGIGVSLFSYAGRVSVGVSSDVDIIAEPERLVAAFEAEIEHMLHPRRSPAVPGERRGRTRSGKGTRAGAAT